MAKLKQFFPVGTDALIVSAQDELAQLLIRKDTGLGCGTLAAAAQKFEEVTRAACELIWAKGYEPKRIGKSYFPLRVWKEVHTMADVPFPWETQLKAERQAMPREEAKASKDRQDGTLPAFGNKATPPKPPAPKTDAASEADDLATKMAKVTISSKELKTGLENSEWTKVNEPEPSGSKNNGSGAGSSTDKANKSKPSAPKNNTSGADSSTYGGFKPPAWDKAAPDSITPEEALRMHRARMLSRGGIAPCNDPIGDAVRGFPSARSSTFLDCAGRLKHLDEVGGEGLEWGTGGMGDGRMGEWGDG
ncbi:hypothetical protein OQA88_4467 [Cercophora sp. LCS_1]